LLDEFEKKSKMGHMGQDSQLQTIKPEDTARIDRRKCVLAQIEAALLAETLSLEDGPRATGSDPYNSVSPSRKTTTPGAVWSAKRVR
jgi:hypothetical protein